MTDNGKIKWIYTREKDDSAITVMQVRLHKGVVGEFPAEAGMIIQVPANTKHAIRDIEEDILLYNVFAPAIPYKKGKE
ncbi:MAG: cupin domain-containing protein [Planctomycetota bacterium]